MDVARPIFVMFYAATGALAGYFLCRIFVASRWIPPLGVAFILGHPLYFFAAGNLYPQQILTPLLLAALVLACHSFSSRHKLVLRSIAIGAITGASLLAAAPSVFSLWPVFLVLAWEDWQSFRARRALDAYRLALAVLVLFACLVPYLVRNARSVHPGLYLSLNSGINLLFGNSPGTTPTSGVNVDLSAYTRPPGESEYDANRRLTQAAVSNIQKSPGHYGRLFVRKCLVGFGNVVETFTHGKSLPATITLQTYMAIVWIGTGILVVLLFRWRSAKEWPWAVEPSFVRIFVPLVLFAYLSTVAGYAVFFMRLRFRLPVDIALCVIAAIGWAIQAQLFFRRRI